MVSSMRARGNKLFFDGNGAKPMQRGDRLASGHTGASGSRWACVFRVGMISNFDVLVSTGAAQQCRAESRYGSVDFLLSFETPFALRFSAVLCNTLRILPLP